MVDENGNEIKKTIKLTGGLSDNPFANVGSESVQVGQYGDPNAPGAMIMSPDYAKYLDDQENKKYTDFFTKADKKNNQPTTESIFTELTKKKDK